MTQDSDLEAYGRASRRLIGLIRAERLSDASRTDRLARAAARLAHAKSLLGALGDPQNRYPVVHVTGTSGKGSVAVMIAAILTAGGYRVGLRTSPYLQVATEKLQIDSRLIDGQSFDLISEQVFAVGRQLAPERALGYPEVWSALSFLWFAAQNVDVAIAEVGAGGRFDSTNVFDPVVSVITSVGLDHTASLGPTLADIAWHKAGIIKRGSILVVGAVPDEAWQVIEQEARAVSAPIARGGASPLDPIPPVGMAGAFQTMNAEIATAAIEALGTWGFSVSQRAIAAGLASARLPGRLERMPGLHPPAVWLDGAHNPDKIAAVAGELPLVADNGPKPVVVLGMLKAKDAATIAAALSPHAGAIVATEPSVIGRSSLPSSELAAAIRASGFAGPVDVEPTPRQALHHGDLLARELGANILVTGSLFLVGHLRGNWYPDDQVVVQRTPWPAEGAMANQALPDRSVAL